MVPLLEERGMEVVGMAGSGQEAIELFRRERPELVLVDLGLPDVGGITLGRQILEEGPETIVLAVTGLNDPQAVKEALRAGFHGYVTKETSVARFVSSVRAAVDGQVVVPGRLAQAAAGAQSPEERDAALLAGQLTAREKEVLALLVEGGDNAQIAMTLGVSANTVRTHVQSILTKLQVRSRLQAAAFAVKYGVVDVPGQRWFA
jgi:two-component system, NarL family, nitrate/nitrite response regulator NarL